jgi:trimethylamine--corrinoid protein Co-methyltransferase
MVLDNELIGMVQRIARGIEVNDITLAVDLINDLDWSESYMDQMHTAENFKSELHLSDLFEHTVRDAWKDAGSQTVLDRCAAKVDEIIANHEPNNLSKKLEDDMQRFIDEVSARSVEEFYKYEGMSAETPAYVPDQG